MGRNQIQHYGGPLIAILLGLATIAGLALTLGGETFRAASAIWFLVLIPHWLVILFLCWLANDFRVHALALPKVKSVHPNEDFILVSEKDWLGMEVSVLLFKQEGNFERLLCAGVVSNIQQNRLVQIRLITTGLEADERKQLINKINDGRLDTLIVKPGHRTEAVAT
ncbi:hypothetical protein [uncultured Sphingomonas sp.]|uniref:hypothetical protein n=1 Tax=uncultured Sphingomonas sp. TaxID=158754 RepID=UPI0025D57E76|nr:hypothetical protein [uncultured Sphingomonas sp.]